MLYLDRVADVAAEHAVAERTVRAEDVTDGAWWEVGLVEGLAQTAAVLNAFEERRAGVRTQHGMLVGVRKFEIRRCARVGETIRFRVDLIRRIAPLALMRGEASCGNEVLASGEIKFYVELEP
jgi:3-hydroxymyristoyl/3-hydroxydecanoyl-(acyl carrier protein) dehydratase